MRSGHISTQSTTTFYQVPNKLESAILVVLQEYGVVYHVQYCS